MQLKIEVEQVTSNSPVRVLASFWHPQVTVVTDVTSNREEQKSQDYLGSKSGKCCSNYCTTVITSNYLMIT